ncbi:MAG: glyceraldehyde-3-phosphate dehydrogenase, partial [delta proteobacterium ML8_F1]
GRIGRTVFRIYAAQENPNFEVVAINGIKDVEGAAHLLKYDTLFGKFEGEVRVEEGFLVVNGKKIAVTNERDPEKWDYKDLGVDLVIESTGKYTKAELAGKHLEAGAKKVIITAPAKDEDITLVLGVNEAEYEPRNHHIISNASCTTNCLAPVAKVINDSFGIEEGLMTTIHSYTNDQVILDGSHKDYRRARAGAENIIPTTTGAAKAVALVIPELKGKFTGMAVRVPTPTVSLVDVVMRTREKVTVAAVNEALKKASENEMKGFLGYCDEPLVSMDFKADDRSSIVDALSTMVMGDHMLKVISWYDNEWGYSYRVVDLVQFVVNKGL